MITTGLIVSWIGVVALGLWALSQTDYDEAVLWAPIAGFAVGMVILSIAPWRRMLKSSMGDWVLLIWSIIALLALLVFELVRPEPPSGIGFLLITFFAAATLMPNRALLGVGIISIIAYGVALADHPGGDTLTTGGNILAFTGAVVFVLLVSIGIRSQMDSTTEEYHRLVDRETALANQEREISQLYDVSRTIGAGTQLDEVLPELVGRVAQAVDARIGLVLLYDPETEHLDLMSPIWAAGHTVHADELSLALNETGIAPRVFMSGDSAVINDLTAAQDDDRLASELDADRIAAVAMRVENRTIGVLLVGDKQDRFTSDDLATLESLAAPAALVLNQMARYEVVRTTGEKMAEIAELKTDFVSVVSHELRTPLTSIIGALSTLQRPELMPTDPRAVQLIEMASKQSNRLRTLIEDLLVMSRIEAESLPVRPERFALDPFIVELLEALPGGDVVQYTSSPDVGRVLADPDHLARVVTNLVENALKYGEDSEIDLATQNIGGEIHLSVIDHGPGIPYEQHDRMFERFTQLAPHATRSKGGAGLGLSIVKGLVVAMNGRVWFEPTVHGGATFTVAIPSA